MTNKYKRDNFPAKIHRPDDHALLMRRQREDELHTKYGLTSSQIGARFGLPSSVIRKDLIYMRSISSSPRKSSRHQSR